MKDSWSTPKSVKRRSVWLLVPKEKKKGLLHGAPNHVNRYSELPKPIPFLNRPGVVVLHFAGRSNALCVIGQNMARRTGQTVMIAAGKRQDSRKLHRLKALTVCSVHRDLSGIPPKMDPYIAITLLTHVILHQKSLREFI